MTLKEFRIKNNLSQFNMAQLLNVSISGYINWERGVMRPNEENQEKIDKLLGKEGEQSGLFNADYNKQ